MKVPTDRQYTEEHEWLLTTEPGVYRVGITDYAQDALGDIVFVELPAVGKKIGRGEVVAEVESTKSVGEVYAPCSGEIVAVNSTVTGKPELVNSSPYEEGWLFAVKADPGCDTAPLLEADGYRSLTEG